MLDVLIHRHVEVPRCPGGGNESYPSVGRRWDLCSRPRVAQQIRSSDRLPGEREALPPGTLRGAPPDPQADENANLSSPLSLDNRDCPAPARNFAGGNARRKPADGCRKHVHIV